jgi:hypothetical protein
LGVGWSLFFSAIVTPDTRSSAVELIKIDRNAFHQKLRAAKKCTLPERASPLKSTAMRAAKEAALGIASTESVGVIVGASAKFRYGHDHVKSANRSNAAAPAA